MECENLETIKNHVVLMDTHMKSDLEFTHFLYESREFMLIWENPYNYLDCVKKLVISNDITDVQKQILVVSMMKLEIEDYLYLLKIIESEVVNGKCSKEVLKIGLKIPMGENEKNPIAENISNENVQIFMKRIKRDIFEKSENLRWPFNLVD